jgi:hypothetical protein
MRASASLIAISLSAAAAILSDFKLISVLELKALTQHVQGIEFNERQLWVTSVDKPNQKGWLREFSRDTGELTRQVEIGEGIRFHPGGLSTDGASLWIPVAEYRPKSSAVIQKRSQRTLDVELKFEVADHIGCIAVTPEFLIGGNWDSKEFYVWDHQGRLIRKIATPTDNGYQDMKFDANQIVASGILADKTGAIDWLDFPSFRLIKRVKAGNTDRGVLFTREGMAIRGKQLMLLPEDDASRVFVFDLGR